MSDCPSTADVNIAWAPPLYKSPGASVLSRLLQLQALSVCLFDFKFNPLQSPFTARSLLRSQNNNMSLIQYPIIQLTLCNPFPFRIVNLHMSLTTGTILKWFD